MLLNFRSFVQSAKFFLTVDDHNMDKRLESSWHLVYYQVSGEPGIAVVVDRTFTSGSVDLHAQAYSLIIAT